LKPRGYTIVELITVMVVLGVLSAIAVPRLMSNQWNGIAWRQEVLSALRHAQKSAVGHRRLVCANVQAAQVSLSIATANPATGCAQAFASPDNQPYASRNNAVVAGGMLGMLHFQPDGRITIDAAGTANVAAGSSITITDAAPIRVDGETGYVD
jgi:MSHA pilin protein MshC